eukprot:3952136-Prymnesium_polylepis.1
MDGNTIRIGLPSPVTAYLSRSDTEVVEERDCERRARTRMTKPNTYSIGLAPSSRARRRACKGLVAKGEAR